MSRVCRVYGVLCVGFVVFRVGLSRVCLSRVGYGTVTIDVLCGVLLP